MGESLQARREDAPRPRGAYFAAAECSDGGFELVANGLVKRRLNVVDQPSEVVVRVERVCLGGARVGQQDRHKVFGRLTEGAGEFTRQWA